MKTSLLRSVVVSVLLSASATAIAAESGLIDFGQFTAAPGREFVEINLKPGLLKFAAKIVAQEEPDAADLLNNVRHIRVNVVGLDESNRADTTKRIEAIRTSLEQTGWEKVVTVRSAKGKGSDDVAIFMKPGSDDSIDGVVVTVIGHDGEAVLVNVVGNIRPEQLAALAEKYDIQPLRKLQLKAAAKAEQAT